MGATTLADNLSHVRERIRRACERAGRRPDDVRLVAVTKSVGDDAIRSLCLLGVTDIGENRVQDARAKQDALGGRLGIRWHMIGHLQTNKARQALGLFDLFHSVDSVHLAQALAARHQAPAPLPILIQCNVSGEESKFGVAPDALPALLDVVAQASSLCLEGLMTMAPFSDDAEASRPAFAGLRELAARARAHTGLPMPHLSMGMTRDFEAAIEEGATMVRIGTALFSEEGEVKSESGK